MLPVHRRLHCPLRFLSPDRKHICQSMCLLYHTRPAVTAVLSMDSCAAVRVWRGTSERAIIVSVYGTRGGDVASRYPRVGSPCLLRSLRLDPQLPIPLNFPVTRDYYLTLFQHGGILVCTPTAWSGKIG